jgi:hypothetical protein
MDPDPAPDPGLFVSGLQAPDFLKVQLHHSPKIKKSFKIHKTAEIKDFLTILA